MRLFEAFWVTTFGLLSMMILALISFEQYSRFVRQKQLRMFQVISLSDKIFRVCKNVYCIIFQINFATASIDWKVLNEDYFFEKHDSSPFLPNGKHLVLLNDITKIWSVSIRWSCWYVELHWSLHSVVFNPVDRLLIQKSSIT